MSQQSQTTVQTRIITTFAVFGVIVLAILAFVFFELSALSRIQDEGAQRAQDAQDVLAVGAMGAELYQVVADTQLNLEFDEAARNWAAVTEDARQDLAHLDDIVDTPEEKAKAREIRTAFDSIVRLYDTELLPKLKAANATTDETRAIDGRMDELAAAMKAGADAVTAALRAESDAGDAEFDATATRTRTLTMVLAGVGFALMIGAATWLLRWLNGALRAMASELRLGAEQVLSASGQVSSSSQALSQGATEQAASLEETSASMEEMASMTRRNAESAGEAATLMTRVDAQVQASHGDLEAMVAAMDAIKESSAKVSKIIKTIDEIAFQTNILALNAAVEAARAGEAGMGFAVVADEVRNLAQRAATASKDTAALIEEASASAQQGTERVGKVRDSIQGFAGDVGKVRGIAEEVSAASRQQSQGIDQVTQAIAQMEKVTQTTAATAEEGAAASEELNAQAEQAMAVVQQLEALVGAAGQHAAPAAAPARAGRVGLRRAA